MCQCKMSTLGMLINADELMLIKLAPHFSVVFSSNLEDNSKKLFPANARLGIAQT